MVFYSIGLYPEPQFPRFPYYNQLVIQAACLVTVVHARRRPVPRACDPACISRDHAPMREGAWGDGFAGAPWSFPHAHTATRFLSG